MHDKLPALYNPQTGRIGCVLLQAGHRGDRSIPHLFDTQEWELAPATGQRMMLATQEQWELLAAMTREERIERWRSKREVGLK